MAKTFNPADWDPDAIADLQNRIVDPRFRDTDYRAYQNYVGETVGWQKEKVHFAGPKPEDLNDLMEELAFLANYDQTKKAIQEVVDMPDRKIDLFIQSCLQNRGRLSTRKRTNHFDFLSDEEVTRMEEAIRAAYGNGDGQEPDSV